MDPVGFTARMTAAARARETGRADCLFTDPFAAALAGPEGFAFLDRHDDAFGSPQQNFAVRTRFHDDHLLTATRDFGIRQVVLLAAGLDTRAFRLDWPSGVDLYELDQSEVLAYKETVLGAMAGQPRCTRHVVAVDLREAWPAVLLGAGYRSQEPTAWVAEGFIFYLPEVAVGRLLDDVAGLSAAGSRLNSDLPTLTFLRSADAQAFVELYATLGAPFQFATDNPVSFFRRHGWNAGGVRADVQGAQLGRPLGPTPPTGPARGMLINAQLLSNSLSS